MVVALPHPEAAEGDGLVFWEPVEVLGRRLGVGLVVGAHGVEPPVVLFGEELEELPRRQGDVHVVFEQVGVEGGVELNGVADLWSAGQGLETSTAVVPSCMNGTAPRCACFGTLLLVEAVYFAETLAALKHSETVRRMDVHGVPLEDGVLLPHGSHGHAHRKRRHVLAVPAVEAYLISLSHEQTLVAPGPGVGGTPSPVDGVVRVELVDDGEVRDGRRPVLGVACVPDAVEFAQQAVALLGGDGEELLQRHAEVDHGVFPGGMEQHVRVDAVGPHDEAHHLVPEQLRVILVVVGPEHQVLARVVAVGLAIFEHVVLERVVRLEEQQLLVEVAPGDGVGAGELDGVVERGRRQEVENSHRGLHRVLGEVLLVPQDGVAASR
ncbi:peptidase M28 [Babesia caballi]|uniref:Peptidase M28 n=1 Tax=Babesia caballi TaxID=5871 RepID=A0AAV4LL36_BABCB|nr:peptidase M28 [Babesia caballi]